MRHLISILIVASAAACGKDEPADRPADMAVSPPDTGSEADDGQQQRADMDLGRDMGAAPDAATTDLGGTDAATPNDMGTTTCVMGELKAFPGAVGFGADTVGGRGGDVYVVDTLADSGPGSLREAVEAGGPRTVVFAVAGTITLETVLAITNPNITINGATAPGGGIALRTVPTELGPAIRVSTEDVVIRYLRVRPGASSVDSSNVDALTVTGGSRMVFANNSFSWATDEVVNFWYDPTDLTLQDNLIYEGLWNSTHPNGPHSKGFLAGPDVERVSLVRNVFASNDDRNPQLQSGTSYELVNNVGYNGYQVGAQLVLADGVAANLVGNVYLPGPDYRPSRYQIVVSADVDYDGVIFVDDNITPRSSPNDPWAVVGWGGIHGGDYNGSPLPSSFRAVTAFPMSATPATPIAAADLVDTLLPSVGASLPARDSADARIVNDILTGGGGLIDSTDDVGGWPTLDAGVPRPDTDQDGMPDDWEVARGLDPQDPTDASTDRGDGYTHIEEYLECPEY